MSTVIKAHAPLRTVQGVAFNFEDLSQQAGHYLDDVRKRAAQIIAEAQTQAEVIRRQAEEDGRQAAMRAVERVLDEKVGKKMETLLPALRKAGEDIQLAKASWVAHWEASAVKLATAIAQRVVRQQLPQMPAVGPRLIAEALEMAAGSSQIRLLLNPTDFETLGGQVRKLAAELSRASPAEIIADPQITAGGCRVETRHGVIDQQFESQLLRIEEELTRNHA